MIHSGNNTGASRGAERRAFSLIELLVVIGVIALIAAMVVGLMPAVTEKRTRARVQAELTALVMAIEGYKEKHGFYPPDGVKAGNPNGIAQPPLFYELVGTTHRGNDYYPLNGETNVTTTQIGNAFAQDGFLNTGEQASEVKNFYKALRKAQYDESPYSNDRVVTIMVPAKGPRNSAFPRTQNVNPWRYIVATPGRPNTLPYPTNNPDSFDLWAEVVLGGKTNVFGNWKK